MTTTPHGQVPEAQALSAAPATPPAEQTFITPETGNSASAKGAAITSESGTPPAEQQAQQEAQEPVAWLVPTLQTFKGAERVHFTRAPGCTMTDAELIDHMEGRVVWIAKTFSDSPGITDKFGVEHKPKPLYTAPQPAPAPLSYDVVKDAARWHMAVLIGNELMMRPEKRTHATAVKAYMDATHSGSDLTGAVDAAIAAQGGK